MLSTSTEPTLPEMVRTLKTEPSNHVLANEIATAFGRRGEPGRAVPFAQQALDCACGHEAPRYAYHLGQLVAEDDPLAGLQIMERAIALAPAWSEVHRSVAWIYRERLKRDDLALRWFIRAARADPADVEAYTQICSMRATDRSPEDLSDDLVALTGLSIAAATVRHVVATALEWVGREAEAISIWRELLRVDPGRPDTVFGLARCHLRVGDLDAAATYFEQAIAQAPDAIPIVFNYIKFLLRVGRFADARDTLMTFQRRHRPSADAWDGADIAGRSFLLNTCNAGHGDAIQFIRLARMLREAGAARVVVEADVRLCRFLAAVDGVDRALPYREERFVADYREDLIDAFLKVPASSWFSTIPPYVHLQPRARRQWRTSIPARETELNVGLVWAARTINGRGISSRSMPFEDMRVLCDLPDVRFFSLQKSPGSDGMRQIIAESGIVDLSEDLGDYMDAAAAVAALDLIVTVDTSAAHLAGAVNQAVALLLPPHADWRWELAAERTPWYPSTCLFRSNSRDGWSGAVQQVKRHIAGLAARRAAPERALTHDV